MGTRRGLISSKGSHKTSRLAQYWGEHPERFEFPYNSMLFFKKWTTEKGDLIVSDFLRAFDFGDLEFGRYVKQNERYERFVGLAEGCFILSSGLFFNSSNLGCDRNINVAIGARGSGGKAAAHFEPANMVINLTKDDGNHSFAHEYAHALDYLLGTRYDQSPDPDITYLSTGYRYSDLKKNVGGKLRTVVTKIVEKAAAQTPEIFDDKRDEYWRRPTEIFARAFEAWVSWVFYEIKEGDGLQYRNSFLVQPWYFYKTSPHVYPTDMEKLDQLFMGFCTYVGEAMNGKGLSGLPSLNKALSIGKARRMKATDKKSPSPKRRIAEKEKSMPPPPKLRKKSASKSSAKKKTVKPATKAVKSKNKSKPKTKKK